MSGDEGKLRFDMLDAVRGKAPRSDTWKKAQGSDSYFSGAGSQNIWLMRFVTQALRGEAVPWEAVYSYQLGPPPGTRLIARGGAVLTTAEPAGEDTIYAPGFGGSEFMSTIYWAWHLLSHLSLIRKGGETGRLARRWVALNWALFRAIQAPDGSLMLFGQRSAGHNPKPRETDWLFALASGGDTARAEAWCRQAGAGLRRGWEFEIGNELLPEMRETWEESLSIKETDLPALLPLRVPTEILRTTEGLAVVHAANCNPNTPPILAGIALKDGRREVFPTSVVDGERIPGGIRIRQQFDLASARIENGEIVYSSSLYTNGAEQRLPLPGGDVIYHLKLGTGSAEPVEPADRNVEPLPIDIQVPAGDPVEEPTPFRDLERAASIIATLQLPNFQKPLQAEIIDRLKSGDVDDDTLARITEQVRGFGIGPGQPQAIPWREAIAILEG